jgi:hypothetical protein
MSEKTSFVAQKSFLKVVPNKYQKLKPCVHIQNTVVGYWTYLPLFFLKRKPKGKEMGEM